VFTVESPQEIANHLKELNVQLYQQKTTGLPDTILLELIDKLLAQSVPQI
jgi:hypothetical protein